MRVPTRIGPVQERRRLTCLDREFLTDPGLVAGTGWRVSSAGYFPGNVRVIGNWFPHHELQVLFERGEPAAAG